MKRILLFVFAVSMSFQALPASTPRRPKIDVRILQPEASNVISGVVQVRARFTPEPAAAMPSQALVGFGGPPWAKLAQVQPSGEWVGTVDTTLVPNGPQTLTVVSDSRYARGAVNVSVTNSLKCFFADLHAHTSYSDGTMIPQVACDSARQTARLDVFAITDHLAQVTDDEWADIREQTDKANEDGRFVALSGLEWTRPVGHICIFDPKTHTWPDNLDAFYQAAADAGVIAKFNHPGVGTNVFKGLAYSAVGDRAVELIEVRRTEEEQGYILALNQGWHLGPDGSDDTHAPNWGQTRAWTGIWAPGLSRRDILDALKARRCFSTLDRNCRLLFQANGEPMGTILTNPVTCLNLTVAVEDPDATDRITRIALIQDGQETQVTEPGTSKVEWSTKVDVKPGSHYWFVKVTQADTNTAWSAPIWATGSSVQ